MRPRPDIRELKILLLVDRQPALSLLPILRSQQQGEILALLLGDPDLELSLDRNRGPHRHSPPFGLPRDPAC